MREKERGREGKIISRSSIKTEMRKRKKVTHVEMDEVRDK